MLDNIDIYMDNIIWEKIVPKQFKPHIIPVYPPNNLQIFEEWFYSNYQGSKTNRFYLPIFPTSYWVNNDYGNNPQARKEIQDFADSLPQYSKYFSICQYDDGFMIDWKEKDVLEFNMSKTNGVMLPLLCQPHPYKFNSEKKYFVSFIGSRTHACRNGLEKYINKEGWYISYEQHPIELYCQIIHESIFVLCPRGYGLNSFRISEAIQYGAIPIYISDEFIQPFGLDFNEYGILVKSEDVSSLATMLSLLPDIEVIKKQARVKEIYEDMYSYEGCLKHIIKYLEAEYNMRQQG